MKKHLALTAALGLALTFTACEEKEAAKKPTEPATTTQQPSQEAAATASESQPSEQKCPNAVTGNGTLSCGGKTYKTVKIGNQTWMAENLNFETEKSYDWTVSGRLYDWEPATKACPSGWHLPSNEEWKVLVTAVGGEKTAGKYLKAKSGWKFGNGTDDFGFSALPGGIGLPDGLGNDHLGYWWSATPRDSDNVYCLSMGRPGDGVELTYEDKYNSSLNVRCIKD